ncbi:MAG: hypothetical protein HYT81_01815 [Gemmatimonadetes bacterium]|nr:hypothetical protein [Gemmatimonadota bacterium]
MRTLTMAALALALAVPAASAQQTGTQAERDAQRRVLQQKMRELQQQMRELGREMARLEPETRATVRALGRVPMVQVFGSRARLGVKRREVGGPVSRRRRVRVGASEEAGGFRSGA